MNIGFRKYSKVNFQSLKDTLNWIIQIKSTNLYDAQFKIKLYWSLFNRAIKFDFNRKAYKNEYLWNYLESSARLFLLPKITVRDILMTRALPTSWLFTINIEYLSLFAYSFSVLSRKLSVVDY